MTKHTIEFSCRRKPTTYEEIKEIERRCADLYTLSGKDLLRTVYEMFGLEFDENIFEKIIEEYCLD